MLVAVFTGIFSEKTCFGEIIQVCTRGNCEIGLFVSLHGAAHRDEASQLLLVRGHSPQSPLPFELPPQAGSSCGRGVPDTLPGIFLSSGFRPKVRKEITRPSQVIPLRNHLSGVWYPLSLHRYRNKGFLLCSR